MEEKYDVRITMRDGSAKDYCHAVRITIRDGSTKDYYHATIKRHSDGVELIWVSDYRWLLKWKIRRKALDKHFRRYDKRQAKLAEVEWISR